MIKKVILIWNTIKYLKMRQILWRLYYFFPFKGWFFPKASNNQIDFRKDLQVKVPFLAPYPALLSVNPLTFCFLNETRTLEDWEGRGHNSPSKLWLYNLHYHTFLLEKDTTLSDKINILKRWIEENPGPRKKSRALGETCAWAPYPLSLRIVNWIKFMVTERINIGDDVQRIMLNSLEEQCDALLRQREYHLMGNHLFENGKALVIAGLFLLNGRRDSYIKAGLQILQEEIPEQILKDGLHFERTPLYHSLILEGMLDLYHFLSISEHQSNYYIEEKDSLEELIKGKLPHMLGALAVITHEDGDLAYFNDTTGGIAPCPSQLRDYATSLGINSLSKEPFYLSQGGFVKLQNSQYCLIADVGPIGPSYIPGHAHAESLCFEASFFGKRLFVNSGISTYDKTALRQTQRSTSAHNCVVIKGGGSQNTAQVWGGFRVAKRPLVRGELESQQSSLNFFSAVLSSVPDWDTDFSQQRQFKLNLDLLCITDQFMTQDNSKELTKEAHYHLHPQWNIDKIEYKKSNRGTMEAEIYIKSRDASVSVRLHFLAEEDLSLHAADYSYALGFNNLLSAQKIIALTKSRTVQLTVSGLS